VGQGLLVYDARDGYDLVMELTATDNASEYYGGPALLLAFQNDTWSTVAVTNAPAFCIASQLAYDTTDGYVVYWGGAGCTSAGETWTYHGGSWQNVTSSTAPPAAAEGLLCNDPGVGGVLWLGQSSPSAGTWSFAAGNWTNLSIGAPVQATGGAMTYDSADHGVLLVEGSTASSYWPSYLVWFFNGTWHAEPKVPSPWDGTKMLRAPPGLADDPKDGYVVAVPAWNNTNSSGVSFDYANGSWTNGTGHPGLAEGSLPAMAYDTGRSQVLLLDSGSYLTPPTIWTYASGNWTNLTSTSTGPGARADVAMTYDAADGYVVAFGGCECSPNSYITGVQSDTWKYTALGWTKLATNASPPARMLAGLVYDASDGYVLLFGGQAPGGALNDTWEFTAGGWTHITPRHSPPWLLGETMAYDAADNYVVLLTGSFPATTWTYHAGVWTNLTAEGDRSIDGAPANPIVYDSTNGVVLLFGTAHEQAMYSPYLEPDTWTFLHGNWTNVTGVAGHPPASRSDASVADFPPGGFVLVYGGSVDWEALSVPRNDTWAYNGSWTQLHPALSPGNRSDMGGAYDAATLSDVFFGGWYGQFYPPPSACTGDGPCADTWLWSGGSPTTPLVQRFGGSPATIDLGRSTNLSVSILGGSAPFAYAYTNLPTGCTSVNASAWTCTPTQTGTWSVTVRVTDSNGHVASAQAPVTVVPALSIAAFFATPSTGELAERTLFSVQVVNGTAPVSYQYTGLPPGCPGQDVPTLPCLPSGTGTFTVGVVAQDAGGANASASLVFSVGDAGTAGSLRVTGYWFAPPTVVLGNSTTISVNATSSSDPLTFAYGGLPPGCASANSSTLGCRPTSAGVFDVTISVRDSAGDLASVAGNLTVDPVGGGGGALSISGFGSSPGNVTVGGTVVLSVVASGGTGPLTYRYPTLPDGCVSADTSALPCSPSEAGTYALYVVVSDSAGHSRGAVGALVVVPSLSAGPAVSAFFATPTNVTYGNATTLIVEAHGSLPLSYAYGGLPPGCTSRDTSVLNCTATDVGTFHITVSATDAQGRVAWANTSFTVFLPTPGPHGPSNPVVASGGASPPVLLWALVGVAVGAAVSFAVLELALARRRLRRDGLEIVRGLSEPTSPSGAGPAELSEP
jgi:hypothetical protein